MGQPRRAPTAEFTAAYRANADFVWRVLARFGVPDAGLEDAMQEVFIVAHRRWGAWEGQASIRAWLYGVARRVASTHHRTQSRQRRKRDALPTPAPEPGLDERLEDRARLDALAQAIASLDEDQRHVFALVDIEELSAPEAAAALGCKLNTVYSRLRRARAKVTSAMAAHEAGSARLHPQPPPYQEEQRHGRAQ